MRRNRLTTTVLSLSFIGSISIGILTGCVNQDKNAENTSVIIDENIMGISKESFGTTPEGQEVMLYTLMNESGVTVKITNYGAIVTSVITPDKNGVMGDVVLGFNSVDGYIPNEPHFGGIIGRFANRIANGKFSVAGQEYTLAKNDSPNHLHGGNKGFDRVVWNAEELPEQNALRLTYLSKDGEEGYPGNLTTIVTYTLTDDNSLKIDYKATTDKTTPVNLTNHSYFNLSAGKQKSILNHVVTINAEKYTVTDEGLIPTGEIASVSGTPYDFKTPQTIGARINKLQGFGYDLNYVIQDGGESLMHAASVFEPTSGRTLDVYTTQPGIQLYTGYHLNGTLTGKLNTRYERYAGLCLEAQHFPDSPNQESFPPAVISPGDTYNETTSYKFGIRK